MRHEGAAAPVISIVAAVAGNGAIGYRGALPWRLPADLAHFKRITTGHAVLMGRKTFQSIGRPLPDRRNIVLTRDPGFQAQGCRVARSVEQALVAAGGGKLFAIGGASVYELFLPLASRLYITRIAAEVPGDAFFPAIDESEWRVIERAPGTVDAANPLPHEFLVYERASS
jgi:dihydrofolate reductase